VHARTATGVGEYNFGGYANAKADALIDKGRLEFDPAKRAALFTEAMGAIEADAGFIPLVYRKITWATRKSVHALPRPNDILDLRFVNLD
jgi:peptide/nickel transport system substrate-binding protein